MHPVKDVVEVGSAEVAESVESYSAWRAWYTLFAFSIQSLAISIDFAIITLLVHPIETAFHINDVAFAASTAVPIFIGYGVVHYPAGLMADTFRRRTVIAIAALIWALAACVAARANSPQMLFFARLLAGIGTGLPWPSILSLLSDAFPRTRRAFALSLYSATSAIAGGVGLTACGALVAATQRYGPIHVGDMFFAPWQQCFIACAAIGIFTVALLLTVPEPSRRERVTRERSNLKSSLRVFGQYLRRHGLLWSCLLLGASFGQTAVPAINAWAPTFGMRHFGAIGTSGIALLGFFGAAGALVGSIGGGVLAQWGINHANPRVVPRMLITSMLTEGVLAVTFPHYPTWLLVAAGIGALGGLTVVINLLLQISTQEAAPNDVRGQLWGLYGCIQMVPNTIGPTLVAFLASAIFAKTGGLAPALALVGGTASLLGVTLFFLSGNGFEQARNEMRGLNRLA